MKNLNKITFLMFASIAIITNANAQDSGKDDETRLRLGIKAGTNYANVYDEKGEDFIADGKFGFVGGGFLSIPIGKFMGLQPEFLISQKGFIATGRIIGIDYELKRTTTWIDVPLLFSLRPIPFLSIVAGPQFSYLMNQKDEFTSSVLSYEAEQEFENEDIRKNMLCFVGGIDINIKHFVISGRAGFDFQANTADGNSTTPRYKNVWLQTTIGLRL